MPEGDTIHNAALRVGGALVGQEILEIETLHPRHRTDRWPERLRGRAVRSVDARGKHLFVRFEDDLTLHSHLRMGGKWGVYERGRRWTRGAHRAWLVIRTAAHDVVQFDGPVLELMTDSRTRFDQLLAGLGPDIVADEFDEDAYVARIREDDQTRAIGEALLDQRNVAGIGNIWKSEGCFMGRVDPWRRVADLSDDELRAIARAIRPEIRASARRGGPTVTYRPGADGPGDSRAADRRPDRGRRPDDRDRRAGTWVYDRAGLPCRVCATSILARGQGDDNRTTYWCPTCQG
ncbi:MAG TPA: DNA-formamidopyrimidine glycosylase family protein [Thermoleophilaceae bacterium]|nr:DNA-formamidopyrimidine glycosylase family protein [Thermoleophilaceae bacterium]